MSDYRFGPAGDPRGAGIGTPEAIKLVWSCHREIIQDIGPILNSWKTPPCSWGLKALKNPTNLFCQAHSSTPSEVDTHVMEQEVLCVLLLINLSLGVFRILKRLKDLVSLILRFRSLAEGRRNWEEIHLCLALMLTPQSTCLKAYLNSLQVLHNSWRSPQSLGSIWAKSVHLQVSTEYSCKRTSTLCMFFRFLCAYTVAGILVASSRQ